MKEDIKSIVVRTVQKISGRALQNIDLSGDIKEELTLDSIQIVELFAALENEFNIELPLELMMVKSGAEFLDKLEIELNRNAVFNY